MHSKPLSAFRLESESVKESTTYYCKSTFIKIANKQLVYLERVYKMNNSVDNVAANTTSFCLRRFRQLTH